MRVSINWLKEYTDIKLSTDDLVKKIGSQLGAVEEVIDLSKMYQGIRVVRVVECSKHSDADKLSVCKIDDNNSVSDIERDSKGYIQVVCGAPNVRSGMYGIWIPPGEIVPSTYSKDEYLLEVRSIRGVKSNGMLASAAELAIGNDHDGIVEVEEVESGQLFSQVYSLDDQVIDIENKMFTHRPDCFGILGVAREVAGISHNQFTSPDWYKNPASFSKSNELLVEIDNQVPSECKRFMAVAISDVTIKKSPLKIQSYLARVGIKPINNVVDATNYLMHLSGQPLHAYDLDKVKALGTAPKLTIRKAKSGEQMTALGGKNLELQEDDIVIAAGEHVVGLGGVIGGQSTEVDASTKNIILECANFDMLAIRRTSMHHGLFTDAVTRFMKGLSPHQNDRILAEGINLIRQFAGGHQVSNVVDVSATRGEKPKSVEVSIDIIRNKLGIADLDSDKIINLLQNVEFLVEKVSDNPESIKVISPFWRTDIEIAEDIVEEVGRLYGYDNILLSLPKRTMNPTNQDVGLRTKQALRHRLARMGANEVLNYSFVSDKQLSKVDQDENEAFQIVNALSPNLQRYRLSLTPGLLSLVHPNIKFGNEEFALFEIGKVHLKSQMNDGLPIESERVGFVYACKQNTSQPAYYVSKLYALELLASFGVNSPRLERVDVNSLDSMMLQLIKPYDVDRSVMIYKDQELVGVIGEFAQKVTSNFKLPTNCSGFELFLPIFTSAKIQNEYQPLSRYPATQQDVCLRVASNLSFQDFWAGVNESIIASKPDDVIYTLTPIDIYQPKKDVKHQQITFRIKLVSFERTLTSKQVSSMLEQFVQDIGERISAERI